jgi:NNP family nitrate/nitrite transporter-like MFS transporter
LVEADGWYLNLIYIVTFGGFIGLSTFLPSFFYSQFHVTKVQAGTLTVLATITGSMTRVVGGWFADRIGGITTLSAVFLVAIGTLFSLAKTPSLVVTTALFMLCFAALGAGNGATFQLVPLRWPVTTAVAGGMIGEIGALGGSILPNVLAQSKQHTGRYGFGFIAYAIFAAGILIMLRVVARQWTKRWVGPGGRALVGVSDIERTPANVDDSLAVAS